MQGLHCQTPEKGHWHPLRHGTDAACMAAQTAGAPRKTCHKRQSLL